MPENDWEILAAQHHMIVVLDEVIASEFVFVVTIPETSDDPSSQEVGPGFISTPVFRVTASFSRFLKRPDGFELLMRESDGTFSFYDQGSIVKHSTLQNVSLDECLQPIKLPRKGDILLIQIEERRWFEGFNIAPYLYDTIPAGNEIDIIDGIRTWNEKDEAWNLEWQRIKEMSNRVPGAD